MDVEYCKKQGIRFAYSEYAVFPQIPRVQDVLYALQLAEEKDAKHYYSEMGAANWSTYIENLMLVSAAVAGKVLNMERYDEDEARTMIAEAICDLCPPEAMCLFNDAFARAQELMNGTPAPGAKESREETIARCTCTKCRNRYRETA
jgi:hypothetical protein